MQDLMEYLLEGFEPPAETSAEPPLAAFIAHARAKLKKNPIASARHDSSGLLIEFCDRIQVRPLAVADLDEDGFEAYAFGNAAAVEDSNKVQVAMNFSDPKTQEALLKIREKHEAKAKAAKAKVKAK